MSQVALVTLGTCIIVALAGGGCSASGAVVQGSGGSNNHAGGSSSGGGPPGGANATGGSVASVACNANVQSSGCTPGQMTQSGTLSGRYGKYLATIGNKQYYLQVNEWGSSATQSLSYGGDHFFRMTQQQASLPGSGAPAGYPSMFIGANNSNSTAGSGLPKSVASLGTVLTSWTWADNGAISDSSAFNAAYDVWFSTNPNGEPGANAPSAGYLMVWYFAQSCQPIGSLTDAGHTIDGIPGCWDVWTGTNGTKPVISYKHQGPLMSLGYDLNLFIRDALNNYPGYMDSNWYLTNIFTGFEIWSGGASLESTSFCAEVN
jgi:hypothetical protein